MLLAVPEQDYEELKHMVDFRQEQRGEPSAPSAEQLRGEEVKIATEIRKSMDKFQTWPESALRRLAKGDTITTQRFSQVMDLCVRVRQDSPDFPIISTTDVAERTRMTVEQWRAACRKMNAHLEKHYPEVPRWPEDSRSAGRPFWPLVGVSGRSLGRYDELYVGITDEQAKLWKRVRATA